MTPDGTRVYAAGFHSGNRTTIVPETSLPDGFGTDGVPGPTINAEGRPAPEIGAIVKWNGAHWVDALGRPRDQFVRLSLPDKDVFVLDAMANPPRQLSGAAGFFQGVTAMSLHPVLLEKLNAALAPALPLSLTRRDAQCSADSWPGRNRARS